MQSSGDKCNGSDNGSTDKSSVGSDLIEEYFASREPVNQKAACQGEGNEAVDAKQKKQVCDGGMGPRCEAFGSSSHVHTCLWTCILVCGSREAAPLK